MLLINLFLLGFASCLWILFGCKNDSNFIHYEVFGVAALIGAGGSTMLITRQDILVVPYTKMRYCEYLF